MMKQFVSPRKPVSAWKGAMKVGDFDSIGEAARQLHLSGSSVSRAAKGQVPQVKGYTFKFLHPEDEAETRRETASPILDPPNKSPRQAKNRRPNEVWRDGVKIGTFESLTATARELGIHIGNVSKALRGVAKTVQGYVVRPIGETPPETTPEMESPQDPLVEPAKEELMEYVNSTHREMATVLEMAVNKLEQYEANRFVNGGPKATGHEYDNVHEAIAWFNGMLIHLAERQSIELAVAENKLAIRKIDNVLTAPDGGIRAEIESLKRRTAAAEAAVQSLRGIFSQMAAFSEQVV